MKQNKMEKLIFGVFAVVGLVLLAVTVILLLVQDEFRENADLITARVAVIESHRDSDGDISHSVFVDYTYRGQEYTNRPLNYYSSSFYEGKEIEIYCNSENPNEIRGKEGMIIAPLITAFLAVVFGLIGIIPTVNMVKKNKKYKMLRQTGRVLRAEVESIDYNVSYRVNGRHPFVLYCFYRDPYKDIIYRFKSGNLWEDPTPFFPVGAEVEVLVKDGDYSVYHVDVEKVLNARVVDYT